MAPNEAEFLSSGYELEQLSPKGVKDIRKVFEQGNSTSTPNYKSMTNTSNSPAFSNPSTPRSSVNLPRNAPGRPSKPAKFKSKPHMPPSVPPPSIPPRSFPPPPPPCRPRPPPPLPCRPRSLPDHSSASDTRSASVSSLGTQDPPPTLEPIQRPSNRFSSIFKSGPLCRVCTKINFSQFDPNTISSNQDGEQYSIELKHLLKERKTCSFCGLLFQALCLPENDPLRDKDLQTTIKEDKSFPQNDQVNFETWAQVRENIWSTKNNAFLIKKDSRWPFGGHTKDSFEMQARMKITKKTKKNKIKAFEESNTETDVDSNAEMEIKRNVEISTNVEFQESHGLDINSRVVGEGAKKAFRVAEEFDNNEERTRWYTFIREMIPDPAFFNEMEKKKVPAALWIIVYGASHKNSGVMEVTVFGCSKRITHVLKTLSHFRLRVASPEVYTEDQSLRYGKIINKTKIDMELCRKWVDHCRNKHGDTCNKPKWSKTLQRPTGTDFRLIDVLKMAIVEPNKMTTQYSYAALSYVWGPEQHSKGIECLKSTNKSDLFKPMSLSGKRVGNVIADAMEITRKLGLRYLWADRLCILQHQQNDKEEQLQQMDRIYGSAVVTIAAASCNHLDEPIVGVTTERSVTQLAEQVTADPQINVLVPCKRNTSLRPWSTRAWTLQEKLLSKRLLVFHDGMVDFYCSCGVSYEDMAADDSCISKPPPLVGLSVGRLVSLTTPGLRLLRSPVFAQYTSLIEQYTPRKMSTTSDAINAISGMLQILITNQQDSQRKTPPLSGLPEEFLDQALHWQPAAGENVRLKLRVTSNNSGNTRFMFPSWSWAAWTAVEDTEGCDGGVRYEAPFRAQTDDDGGLKKVVPDEGDKAEEFMRPLLKWYVVDRVFPNQTHPRLRPLNKTGLGLALNNDVDIKEWNILVSAATGNLNCSMPSLDNSITRLLTDQHLVFRTKIAQFRLGKTRIRTDTTWKRNDTGKLIVSSQLKIRETPIMGGGIEVGRVWLPDPDGHTPGQLLYDFALISEAQYFGDEDCVDFTDYPLFNVMLLSREDGGRPFARREAMGRLTKKAWRLVPSREEVVVLG
ncbi:heterokaryon incompatibility protein-domain-containing protein [Ilyonectria robusta]|uniref:heterokaryon incompatibility protein-domain-containing protein n=1 Tax=Ilyonectria robusta TaxID=1079257 RepID=UPI001E8EB099|nr:heterokaryon incompatibility protein-domain-containing protein [Ilyonectria robusta]KAH8686273.1 heterokaryon incompatibility protein-domain-containing protein [Ilyonectria robusta]